MKPSQLLWEANKELDVKMCRERYFKYKSYHKNTPKRKRVGIDAACPAGMMALVTGFKPKPEDAEQHHYQVWKHLKEQCGIYMNHRMKNGRLLGAWLLSAVDDQKMTLVQIIDALELMGE